MGLGNDIHTTCTCLKYDGDVCARHGRLVPFAPKPFPAPAKCACRYPSTVCGAHMRQQIWELDRRVAEREASKRSEVLALAQEMAEAILEWHAAAGAPFPSEEALLTVAGKLRSIGVQYE